ncbi:hypothetical protein [Bradyrhizobium pachyrhizi]|uniref:hypothetical protein n=1 Tax=Bradyrhizobium pachyrhizi TaxID=280333 RepID=UPI000AFCB633|nr:hypothetical protein [Bradyrhizobium pachyrhizi]
MAMFAKLKRCGCFHEFSDGRHAIVGTLLAPPNSCPNLVKRAAMAKRPPPENNNSSLSLNFRRQASRGRRRLRCEVQSNEFVIEALHG